MSDWTEEMEDLGALCDQKPPTQGGTVTHSETPTQELIMKGHGTRSEGDGATEENAMLEGWQESRESQPPAGVI